MKGLFDWLKAKPIHNGLSHQAEVAGQELKRSVENMKQSSSAVARQAGGDILQSLKVVQAANRAAAVVSELRGHRENDHHPS